VPYHSTTNSYITCVISPHPKKMSKITYRYVLYHCSHNSKIKCAISFHSQFWEGPGWLIELDSWITYQLTEYITYTAWVRTRLSRLQKGCTRLTAISDRVYQLLAHGRWFSPGTSTSSTNKTGRHDIVEILLKVALNTKNQMKLQF
jgi:hypothetical protein